MSIKIEMYMIVGRKYLEEYYNSSFKQFENCCGVCWCCIGQKSILGEFEKKGFNSFNSAIKGSAILLIHLKLLIFRNQQFQLFFFSEKWQTSYQKKQI